MAAAADWSSIPFDLLLRIMDFVPLIKDYIRVGAVCRWWYAAISIDKKRRKFFPLLMLAADTEEEDSNNSNNNKRGFYSFSADTVFEIEFPPEIKGRRCWSSPGGWLVTFGLDMQLSLFNAFSRVHIPLPQAPEPEPAPEPEDEDEEEEEGDPFVLTPEILLFRLVHKAVVDPAEDCKLVLVIYTECSKLGFGKPGDSAWSPIAGPPGYKHPLGCKEATGFRDIIHFNGNFYALNGLGELYMCDFSSSAVLRVVAASPSKHVRYGSHRKYLVDLGGELCMLVRNTEPDECCTPDWDSESDDDSDGDSDYSRDYSYENKDDDIYFENTTDFEVYKLDMRKRRWKRVSSLGDWSVFVGNNYTFSIRASDFQECNSNSVYFTDDDAISYCYNMGCDRGIYSIEEDEIYPFPMSYHGKDLKSEISPPLWITPCL